MYCLLTKPKKKYQKIKLKTNRSVSV